MDLVSYFEMRERDLRAASAPENVKVDIAPDGATGTLLAIANLRADTELDAYLKVFERAVRAGPGKVEVVKYSYYLVINGQEAEAWEKDPTHVPAVHGHKGPDHAWVPRPEVTLPQALDLAWDQVQLYADTEPLD